MLRSSFHGGGSFKWKLERKTRFRNSKAFAKLEFFAKDSGCWTTEVRHEKYPKNFSPQSDLFWSPSGQQLLLLPPIEQVSISRPRRVWQTKHSPVFYFFIQFTAVVKPESTLLFLFIQGAQYVKSVRVIVHITAISVHFVTLDNWIYLCCDLRQPLFSGPFSIYLQFKSQNRLSTLQSGVEIQSKHWDFWPSMTLATLQTGPRFDQVHSFINYYFV